MNFEGSALLGDSGPAGPSPLPGQAPERGEEPVSGTGLLPLPLPLHQRVPLDAGPGGRVSGGGPFQGPVRNYIALRGSN